MFVSLDRAGGIYIISYGDDKDYVKVGMSNNFYKRFATFLRNTPYPLNIECIFPVSTKDRKALEVLEKSFHQKFESLKHVGEWFHREDNLDYLIDCLQSREKRTRRVISRGSPHKDWHDALLYGWNHSILSIASSPPPPLGYPLRPASCLGLSEAEWKVAELVPSGMKNFEIAEVLDVSAETVKSHISSAMSKLALTNRTQLAVAVCKGLAF